MKSPRPIEAKADINVTPLVDVLLVLLVIFMMVTPILTTAMDSDIPRRPDPHAPVPSGQIVVVVTAEGRCLLDGKELAPMELLAPLRERLVQPGSVKLVFLDADDAVPYGTVVQIMDLCRTAGATNIGVMTAPRPAAGAAGR